MPTPPKTDRFQALDSWRGICALLVAATHFHIDSHVYTNAFLRHAGLFVDFFFVLSGFVITHAYGHKLASAGGLREFVIRRFGRLWPLHAAMLLLFVSSTLGKVALTSLGLMRPGSPAFEGGTSAPAIVTNLLMVHALGLHDRDTWNGPSWSISVEWITYLVFAAVSFVFLRKKRQVPPALLVAIALSAGLAVLALSPAYLETTFDFGILRCIYGFFVGSAVYRLWLAMPSMRQPARHLELVAIAAVVSFVVIGDKAASMAAPLVFGFAVLLFAYESGPVSRLLRMSVPSVLGAWSYSIYLTHAFIVHLLFVAGRSLVQLVPLAGLSELVPTIVLPNQLAGDFALLAYLFAVIGASSLTYRWIELPGQNYFNKLAAELRQAAHSKSSQCTDR
jgi:peptidoglycan/LPS O-acetylase OafA/YrhL